MTRTSVYLGLALWGLVMSAIVSNGLVIVLIIMGALSLIGVCVVLMGYVVYKAQGGFDD